MRIRALGDLRVETAEGSVDRLFLSQRPGRLLRYLVAQSGRLVPADEIAEALRPGAGASADDNVRYLVHALRKRLEPTRPARGPSLSIRCIGGAYTVADEVWIDSRAFEQAVDHALRRLAHGDEDGSLSTLRAALELYGGEFLADEPYEDWAIQERERLHALAADAMTTIADIYERRREFASALRYARWLAELEPYDSDAQRRVVTLCLRCGRRGEATRRYGAFRARLLKEFGEEPDFSLVGAWPGTGASD